MGYWSLDGDGTDSGPNELHGTPVNAEFVDGLRGQAFFFTGDDTLHIPDDGDSPLDVDAVLMVAWIMPSHLDVSADRGIIMNKSVAAAYLVVMFSRLSSAVGCLVADPLLAAAWCAAEKAPTSTVSRTTRVRCKEPSDQAAGAGGAL